MLRNDMLDAKKVTLETPKDINEQRKNVRRVRILEVGMKQQRI